MSEIQLTNKEICQAESLKSKVNISYQCKTENGIEKEDKFFIDEIIGNYEQVVIVNQFAQSYTINANQLIR